METANFFIFAFKNIRKGVVKIASPLPILNTEPNG